MDNQQSSSSSSGLDLKMPPPNLPVPVAPVFPPKPSIPPLPNQPIRPPTPAVQSPIVPKPATPSPAPVAPELSPTFAKKADPGTGDAPEGGLPQREGNVGTGTIRTMQDDLAALSKGKTPVGVTPEITPPVPPSRPAFTPPPHPVRAPADQPSPGASARITIPPPPKKLVLSRAGLLVILAVLIVVGFSLWLLVFREPSSVIVESPTPSIMVTPTPVTVPPLESAFTVFEKVAAPLTPSFFGELEKLINTEQLVAGEPGLFKVISPASVAYPFSDFALGTDIPSYPASVQEQIYDDSLYLTMLTKADGKLSRGFILKAKDAVDLATALRDWESTMTNDLKKLFSLNIAEAAFAGFLDNAYRNVAVRYRNFPDSLSTIDYAVVSAPNGEDYLVFASSKTHIYAVIEKIKSIVSGEIPGK